MGRKKCNTLKNSIERQLRSVLHINFEKAYDHMNWGFLDNVLSKKGTNEDIG